MWGKRKKNPRNLGSLREGKKWGVRVLGGTCMASEPIVGEGDGAREKQRYTESKAPRRRASTTHHQTTEANPTATTATATTTTAVTAPSVTHHHRRRQYINKNDNHHHEKDNNINQNDNNKSDKQDNNKKNDENEKFQQLLPPPDAAASGDSSSLNRQEVAVAVVEPESRDPPVENGLAKEGPENRMKINLASRSKQEMRELRRKLESELDTVRSLMKRIEAKQGQIGGFNLSLVTNEGVNNSSAVLRRVHSEVASVGVPREVTRPLHQLSISVLENSQGMSDIVEKEKRTPKANQFYHNSEFLLAKDKFPPAESNKKSKLNGKKHGGGDLGQGYGMGSKFFKSCSSLLEKLMKHKHGWVFNEPVDAAKLGLHDYHIIIKHPMDLGTIKSRLNKNWYKSPKEFAEDVRLTFHNAMTYNPQGQDVHVMAEQLSRIFEDRWAIIESDYNREMRFGYDYGASLPTPTSRKAPPLPPPPLDMRRILDRSESISHHVDPKPKPMTITPRTPAPKKPKAKDPHKRDMTYEEKQKLSTSLPSEKLDSIVQIIKRRNSDLFQHDDEIEVDIDSVDVETLWELDRFVTNYKKSLSKHKRKAEMAMQARAETEQNVQQQTQDPIVAEVPKETKTDEKIISSSTPIQGITRVIIGVGQVVQAALAVILDLPQVTQIVIVRQHLDQMRGRRGLNDLILSYIEELTKVCIDCEAGLNLRTIVYYVRAYLL
ncbi:global transcription factor group E4 [Prunus dulcis]|uniref:Global transcription factor group E4 n=1 Tax=Prunus dulcis TaxID=3755 RepID=A0A4Y1R5P2_PRUDU|nr:global transcription factor group E4 [Prunus dulcis]